jgi:hypothetical protein
MKLWPALRSGWITSDGLRSCATPHGRLSSGFRGCCGHFDQIPGTARWAKNQTGRKEDVLPQSLAAASPARNRLPLTIARLSPERCAEVVGNIEEALYAWPQWGYEYETPTNRVIFLDANRFHEQ